MTGNPTAKVFERAGNPLWPLPPDYARLSGHYKRLARLNAVRMQQTPELAVYAWRFFVRYYLMPDEAAGFNPFFYIDPKPLAKFHSWMVYWFESHQMSAIAFPRGGGKTTNSCAYSIFKVVTCEQCEVGIFVNKVKPAVQKWSDWFNRQLLGNDRILADFGPQRMSKGDGAWGVEYKRLINYSALTLQSFEGNLRGGRGRFNLADDVDQEDKDTEIGGGGCSADRLEEYSARLRGVVLPMMKSGTALGYIGTVRQGTLLDHILTACEDGHDNNDSAFQSVAKGGYWHKFRVGARDDSGQLLWPEGMSDDYLKMMQATLGPRLFASEFGSVVTSENAGKFRFNDTEHTYRWQNRDGWEMIAPFESSALVEWSNVTDPTGNRVVAKSLDRWADWVATMARVVVIDPATSSAPTADDCAIHCVGIDQHGNLWSLDLETYKGCRDIKAVDHALKMALRWRCSHIGIEAINLQEQWVYHGRDAVSRLPDDAPVHPQVVAIRPPRALDKFDRISLLEGRFYRGQVKYPADRRTQDAYAKLWLQTLGFGGTLRHEDCIDTVEMAQRLIDTVRPTPQLVEDTDSPLAQLMHGETHDAKTGMPLLALIPNIRDIPPAMMELALEAARTRQEREAGHDDIIDLNLTEGGQYEYVE